MTTENKKPKNILAAIESEKGNLANTVKQVWEDTKQTGSSTAVHFCKLQLALTCILKEDPKACFILTLGMLADHLLPILTEEEKEALRNESTML